MNVRRIIFIGKFSALLKNMLTNLVQKEDELNILTTIITALLPPGCSVP
ncbi:hypothetical protein QE422_003069 [Chryseobacterium sp. SORGH_AS 447]|nr:hypothetical protein [Chryseobacterium sp. SORGH_AS_0447]